MMLAFILTWTAFVAFRVTASPTVTLDYSSYEGTRDARNGVDSYLGMRYAAPPIGNLRFRSAEDPLQENKTQPAKEFGPICVGVGQSISPSQDEDCLYVNVFAPSNATSTSKLPVWLYIQGGGYATNSNKNYNGTEVIRESGHNIVFVNFNYRVGLFGFLASEQLREDGDLNVGLLDQRKLLLWVQKHIHKFGGDPNHVVIHGTSAGGGSVSYHLAAYGGRNDHLFVGAVAQSPFWPTSPTVGELESQYRGVLSGTGCDASPEPLACLRELNSSSLIPLNVKSPFPSASGIPIWSWLPVKDGDLIRDDLSDLFNSGDFIRVPLIVANDDDEGSNFAPNANTSEDVTTFFKNNYPKLNDTQLHSITDMYPLMPSLPKHGPWFPSASAAYGDATFNCPGQSLSASMARYHDPAKVWNYRCYITSPSTIAAGQGTPHAYEIPAIFGLSYGGSVENAWLNDNAASIPITMRYYISFVRSLNPNTYRLRNATVWQPWGGKKAGNRLRLQTHGSRMELVSRNQTRACAMWDNLSEVMEV